MLRAAALLLVLLVGCATGESLDEGNAAGGAPAGGGGAAGSAVQGGGGSAATTSGGGNAGAGATTSGGGAGGTGGATTGGTGGGDDGGLCPLDQKNCQGTCVPLKNPYTGCSNADCKECPAPPANATSVCTTGLCDFKCNGGYTKQGSSCVSSGGGGGSGGTGGTTSGGGGTTASGGGGTGGGTCSGACDPSNPAAHIICAGICALSGQSIGLCAPFLNCCLCSS